MGNSLILSVSFPSHTPLNKDICKNIIDINALPLHMPLYGYVCRNDVIDNVSLSLSHVSHYTVVRGNAVALVGISSLVSLSRDIYRNTNSAISFLSHMSLNGFICSGSTCHLTDLFAVKPVEHRQLSMKVCSALMFFTQSISYISRS